MSSTVILRRPRKETPVDEARATITPSTYCGSPGPAEKPGTKSPRDRARQLHAEVLGEFRAFGVVDREDGRR